MQAVLDALADGNLQMPCLGLIADKADRECVTKAQAAGIPVCVVERDKSISREENDARIQETIASMGGDPEQTYIAALGWMFILSGDFVQTWRNRIINVHPSLLPAHPGGHAIRDCLEAGDSASGMTIHFIDEGVDTGPIILQKQCTVEEGETEDSLKQKIQALEKEWYPKVLAELWNEEMKQC